MDACAYGSLISNRLPKAAFQGLFYGRPEVLAYLRKLHDARPKGKSEARKKRLLQ
jgi:hypothetical protein